MQYKIIVDKQSRTNPSINKKEYVINIEELRYKGSIYDKLVINVNEAFVERRLQLSKYGVLTELDTPQIEKLKNLNIELFEGDNYIYLMDLLGNHFYAEYVIKNDLTSTFVTGIEMNTAINQTAQDIMLTVNRKVDGEEFGTYIQQNWEAIKFAWNQISQYLQLEGINGKATLNIYNGNHNMLMSLSQDGETFFDENGKKLGTIGIVREKEKDILAFSMPVDWKNVDNSRTMAWGIVAPDKKFLPIFYLGGYYGAENSEYGGRLIVEGELSTSTLEVVKRNRCFVRRNQF